MRRRLILLSLVLMGALLVGLIACTSEEGGPGTPSATPTSTAPIIPTSTVTLTPEPTAEDGPRRTGDAASDAVIDAVEARDLSALSELVEYAVLGCTHALGMGGPPKCEAEQAEGDPVRVFPLTSCEAEWTAYPIWALGQLVGHARGLYAVTEAPEGYTVFDGAPPADTFVVFHADRHQRGFRLNLSGGAITSITMGCSDEFSFAEYDGQMLPIVAGPWEDLNETEAVRRPSAGIAGLDDTLAAVATYDLAALYEGAVRAMQETPTVACEAEQIMEGPAIACDPKNGEVDGTLVHVFPSAYCHGAYDRSPLRPVLAFLNQAPVLHSVFEAPSEPSPSANFPHGAYWAIYELTAKDAFPDAVRLHISDAGQVLVVWYGCDGTVERLMDGAGTEVTISLAE